MHPIRLQAHQTVNASGQLADDTTYALDVKIVRVDPDAVAFSYAGRLGTRAFPSQ